MHVVYKALLAERDRMAGRSPRFAASWQEVCRRRNAKEKGALGMSGAGPCSPRWSRIGPLEELGAIGSAFKVRALGPSRLNRSVSYISLKMIIFSVATPRRSKTTSLEGCLGCTTPVPARKDTPTQDGVRIGVGPVVVNPFDLAFRLQVRGRA